MASWSHRAYRQLEGEGPFAEAKRVGNRGGEGTLKRHSLTRGFITEFGQSEAVSDTGRP